MATTLFDHRMDQEWVDLMIWEEFFKAYPIKAFIELGTGMGGMSLFFALQAYQRKFFFHTFDNQKWMDFDNGLPKMLVLKDVFHHVDLFKEGYEQIAWLIENMPHPIAIFFDDGDKRREWKEFAPLMHPDDFCVVHDWGNEFFQEDTGDVPVERIMTDLCDKRPAGYQAMWFKRI